MNPSLSPATGSPPTEVLILGAGFNTGNRGVAALACGTLASIFHSHPDARVAVLDYAKAPATYSFPYEGRPHEVALLPLRFSKNPFQPNHVLRLVLLAAFLRVLPASMRARWIAGNPWLRAIERAEIIGALSGGDSFSDLYGLRRLLYVSLPQLLVLALGRPLTLLPQSYGPFQSRPAEFLARSILHRAAGIYSRDPDGLVTIRRLAPAAGLRAAFAFDMGFALEPHPPSSAVLQPLLRAKRSRPLVGLNISGLLSGDGPTGTQDFGLREPYGDLMVEAIVRLVRHLGATVVLIPHVFGQNGESDVTAAAKLWRRLPAGLAAQVLLIDRELNQHEVKYVIGQCDFFIGARMHACIAALSQAVPTVALAYSHKFDGVLSSIDADQRVVDLRRANRAEVLRVIETGFAEREPRRSALAARSPAVRESVLGFFRRLQDRPADPARMTAETILPPSLHAA
jgi:colanic acid/amylovoran biosynthesis protein